MIDRAARTFAPSRIIGLAISLVIGLALSLSLSACGARNAELEDGPAPPRGADQARYVPDQLIVRFQDTLDAGAIAALLAREGAHLLRPFQTPSLVLVGLPEGSQVEAWKVKLEALPEIISADPNFIRRPSGPNRP
jgi:fervidolysin-like protein